MLVNPLAVHAAELASLRAEIELARRVHRSLLAQPVPHVAGLDVFALTRPALEIGGDFYDFVCRPGRPLVFSVGDVTGKGMSAALLMTMTRTAIRSKASFLPDPAPHVVLKNSNADLYDDFVQVGMFATAFVGRYQAEERQLVYANAGQAPVIYRPAGGAARLLRADDTALGILPVAACTARRIAAGPGDLLLVATDGLSDARDDYGRLFGYERLLTLADQLAEHPARTIAETLIGEIDRFRADRPQDDDETLVVIKGVAA